MELLLLLGLAGLFAFTLALSSRVKQLERKLAEPRTVEAPPAGPDPLFEARRAAQPVPPVTVDRLVRQPDPEPEAAPEPEAPPPVRETLGGFFERWVGGRLMIWVGGVALAVAGVLLVRYSVQIGLITPAVQMGLATLFGLVLLVLGEFARSRPDWALDRRVAQALV